MAGPSSRVMCNKAIGHKHKAIGNKNASPPSKKKSVPGGKTSCQGKVVAKSSTRGNIQRGHTPRKTTENLVSPQVSPVQDQSVSPVQSVTAVSPHASMVTSPIQSMAMPHPASLAAVFKEMMDAAQVNETVAPTINEIEAEYECRQAALNRPASPRLSHTPPKGPVLSEAAVQVVQAELQSAKSKMAVLEARAEWSESEMSSTKTLMHSMMQTMQGMQSIMSSNMATAIVPDNMKSPEPSCSSRAESIVSASSRDSSVGSSPSSGQSRYKMRKGKHHRSKHCSQSPSSSSESEFKSVSPAGSIPSHESRSSRNYEQDPRLPNFTGKEAWKVWFTRFNDIATC